MGKQHAVVIGGSIGGLLAAAGIAQNADADVTIVEKESVPDQSGPRKGVPQGTQVHALLAVGQQNIEALLPGFVADAAAAGAALVDGPYELAVYSSAGWSGRAPSTARVVCSRRPLLEDVVRRRVLGFGAVTTTTGSVTELIHDAAHQRVTGVRLRDGREIFGDLIIDASGRSSKAPEWLSVYGYDKPEEREIRSNIGYATVTVRLPDNLLPPGVSGVTCHPNPRNHRGGAIMPCDNGFHQLSALSMIDVDPPRTFDQLLEFVDAASSPIVGQLARKVEPVGDLVAYRMRGSRRRVWEELGRHPEGFVVLGDAVMSFNPLYGQGMSMAAVQANLMTESLAVTNDLSSPGLAKSVQNSFKTVIDTIFDIVLGVDTAYDGVELVNVGQPRQAEASVKRALAELATMDPEVSLASKYVGHYFQPELLRTEAIREKVSTWIREGRRSTMTDPLVIPAPLRTTVQ